MDKRKMSPHSRAALDAADTMKRVIGGMSDAPFMSERMSDRSRRRGEMIESSPDAMSALSQGLTRAYAERVARSAEDR